MSKKTMNKIYLNQFINLINNLSDECILNSVENIINDKRQRRRYQRLVNRCFHSLVVNIAELIANYMQNNHKRGLKHVFINTSDVCFNTNGKFPVKCEMEYKDLRLFPDDAHFKTHLRKFVLNVLNGGTDPQRPSRGGSPKVKFYDVLYNDIKSTLDNNDFISVDAFKIVAFLHTNSAVIINIPDASNTSIVTRSLSCNRVDV